MSRFLGIELVEAIVLKDSVMSLNRYEQILINYLECHSEEKRFWEAKVTEISRRGGRRESRALELYGILWEYFEERARFESRFREVLIHEGDRKISMLNLSEYLLRMWAPLPQKKRGLC